MVFKPVLAHKVDVTAESIPPDTPTTKPFKPIRKGTVHIKKKYKPTVIPIVIDGFRRSFDKRGLMIKKRGILQSFVIKEPLISYQTKYFLNIHGAIVPNYRNVHGPFWSYYFKDFQNMGSSILYLTKGIDNGNVASISNLDEKPSSLKDLHLKTLVLSNNLTDKLIRNLLIENKLDSVIQNENVKPFYGQTPRFIDFIKLWI